MNSSHVVYEFGGFHLDRDERVLRRGNAMVPLTPRSSSTADVSLVMVIAESARSTTMFLHHRR